MKLAIILEGGIGDMISQTGLLRNSKSQYLEIHAKASYSEIFLNSPNIYITSLTSYDDLGWYEKAAKNCDASSTQIFINN